MRNLKKLVLIAVLVVMAMSAKAQLKVDAGGSVGINGLPQQRLHVWDNRETQLLLQNVGGDGAGIQLKNSNGHTYTLCNKGSNYWGHTNTFDIRNDDGYLAFQIYPDHHINLNSYVNFSLGGRLSYGSRGNTGDANGFLFNPRGNVNGFMIEQGAGESSGIYGDEDCITIWSPGDYNLLNVIDEDGMQLRWYIDGSGNAYTNSDKKRKENISKINSPLNKVRNLSGVTYNFLRTDKEKLKDDSIINGLKPYKGDITKFKEKSNKKHSGFIAQEIEQIIPEVVETDDKGDKFVNYEGVIPYLVEAFKEQQSIIESLQAELKEVKDCCAANSNKLKSASVLSTTTTTTQTQSNTNALYQNAPNPFSTSTKIQYYLTESVQKAMICIYTMNGQQLKCFPLTEKGYSSIIVDGSQLTAGMYIYSLLVDGQEVDTKRMILTE